MKISFDFRSLRFKLWAYFIFFAIIIMGLIWFLQIFFLNNYYEDMKIREADKVARQAIESYNESEDLITFEQSIKTLAYSSDSYIRIENGFGDLLLQAYGIGTPQGTLYQMQARDIRNQLAMSKIENVSRIITNPNNTKTLIYGCYLYKATDTTKGTSNKANSVILFVVSPLYPVQSTVSILQTQLEYITIIAMLLALLTGFYMASKISRPIKDITYSAEEMGQGNYGVQFDGGPYSEISNLANTLTTASLELEKSANYQKDLLANVGHDLKTPLTMIRSYAEMIRDLSGDDPKKRLTHLNVIMDEADRLNTLVNDILNISKMQKQEVSLELSKFDIVKVSKTLLSSYEILSEQEGYEFTFKSPDSVFINADKAKITQAISNFINNAVKYCGSDKQISITIKKMGKKFRYEVSDHGQGIAPDEISHVWERYYKSSTNHVRSTEGTGLGLSIVKEILLLHNFKYGVESVMGDGSTFWFEFEPAKNKNA